MILTFKSQNLPTFAIYYLEASRGFYVHDYKLKFTCILLSNAPPYTLFLFKIANKNNTKFALAMKWLLIKTKR